MRTRNGSKFKIIPAHELRHGDIIPGRKIKENADDLETWYIEEGPYFFSRNKVTWNAIHWDGRHYETVHLRYTIGTAVTVYVPEHD